MRDQLERQAREPAIEPCFECRFACFHLEFLEARRESEVTHALELGQAAREKVGNPVAWHDERARGRKSGGEGDGFGEHCAVEDPGLLLAVPD